MALIPPDCLLHKKGDIDFILAQRVAKSTKYRDHYASIDTYKLMDHGAYERDLIGDFDDTLQIADSIDAAEIVLPDEIMKPLPKTFYDDLVPSLPKNYRYMIVPQGRDPAEWRENYLSLCEVEGVQSIGIPIWLDKEFGSRAFVTCRMFRHGELNLRLEHHLLGLDNIYELYLYPPGLIRSIDTSLPFSMAYSKMESPEYYDPPEHKRIPDDVRLRGIDLDLLECELRKLREITRKV